MKIATNAIEGFLAKPDSAILAILLYGPDEGQARSHAQKLVSHYQGGKRDPMSLTELDSATLSEDPARLSDELGSYSLMGGDRVIWLRQASNDDAKLIEQAVCGSPAPAWPLIVTAGELRPTSKLRKLFESHKQLAAVACYRDEARKLTQILAEGFRERNIVCEQGVIPMLAESMGNDRAITLQEIEKIDCYLGDETRHLDMKTALLLVGDNSDHTLDELFHSICGGQSHLIEQTLTRCFHEGLQPIAIYRMLSSHFQKLLSIQSMMQKGMAQKAALTRHGVFFKQENHIIRQLQLWRDPAMRRAITAILQAEQATKRGQLPAELICRNLLLKLSLHATPRTSNNRRVA